MVVSAPRFTARNKPIIRDRQIGTVSALLLIAALSASSASHAEGEINQLITSASPATPGVVSMDGSNHSWGQDENLDLDGFVVGNEQFAAVRAANSVSVLRRDIAGVASGELCGIFAEQLPGDDQGLKPDFPALPDLPSVCDMSAILMSTIINRGTLDTFSNTGGNPTNIERIDYVFDGGIVAPADPTLLPLAGHAIGEKQGNNRVQMAAILAVDGSGLPTRYGPLIGIGVVGACPAGGICYGSSSVVHDYVFFKSHSLEPLRDIRPVSARTERVSFAFLSLETLQIPAGSTYYGVSVFPHDIDAVNFDLLDIDNFPSNTEEPDISPSDTADIYGGSSPYYTATTLKGVSGHLRCQVDDSETRPLAEAGLSLYLDSVADGVLDVPQDQQIATLPGTGRDGSWSFEGLENGSYFLALTDRSDEDASLAAFVINDNSVTVDIVLDEPCIPNPPGPTAIDDEALLQGVSSRAIEVLLNDLNADGIVNARELTIIGVSDSSTATLEIQGRTVFYTAGTELMNAVTPTNPVTDTFDYTIADDQGMSSEATVTVTIRVTDDPSTCLEEGRTDCLFVETEVEGIGVGRMPALSIVLLAALLLTRRHLRVEMSSGDQS